ncbi:MAG: hypothetical protein ABI425_04310 [Patescibacteria group bacterium]
MPQDFFHQEFLRNVDLDLFNQYLQFRKLPILQLSDQNELVNQMVEYVDNVPLDQHDAILTDFISARELASDGGIKAVYELNHSDEFIEKMATFGNHICRALYCLIEKPDLFGDALTLKQLVNTTNFYTRNGLKKVEANEVLAKQSQLELELSAFLQKAEGRGKSCSADAYHFRDRVCFIAHPEDHPRSYLFYEGQKLNRKVHHPSFDVIFVYYPEEGRIELTTRMGYKKRQQLFNLFNRIVLNDPSPVPANQQVLRLDKILHSEFKLITEPEDQVDSVYLSQIRLDNKYNRKKRFIVQIDDGKGIESMLEELKYRNLLGTNLEYYTVAQATFKFQFKQFGRNNRVTAQLTAPDRDTLNETASNQLAKKYIGKWGLLHDADSTTD